MLLVIEIPSTKCSVPYAFMPDPYRFLGEVTAHSWGQASKSTINVESFWNHGYKISLWELLVKEHLEAFFPMLVSKWSWDTAKNTVLLKILRKLISAPNNLAYGWEIFGPSNYLLFLFHICKISGIF